MALRARSQDIRSFLLRQVYLGKRNLIALAMKEYRLSRQAVHGHLAALVQDGVLEAKGRTRARQYSLHVLHSKTLDLPLQGMQEDLIWSDSMAKEFAEMPTNALRIWQHGFAEMLNNAIEHSGSLRVRIIVERTAVSMRLVIGDFGVGIFRKIKDSFHLSDEREAILELMKGKLTTDPEAHTGEGIFFCSRMFDHFMIASFGLVFTHLDVDAADRLFGLEPELPGTTVWMDLLNETDRTAKSVFDRYSSTDGDYAFVVTDIPVRMMQQPGELLVSRSQARRLMARLEKFKHVILDFSGVPEIGQAFADEVFRVYPRAHPQVKIEPVHVNRRVAQMIRRARAAE